MQRMLRSTGRYIPYGATRPRMKAFHITARHNKPGKMNMPGNYVLKRQYDL
ncbi:MAG: hypothetical protein LBR26_00440 [Prevotella sp.]|nr:hypothetical protein [Prevotella sp.]